MSRADQIQGCLLGMAAGDAIGLPRESIARGRAARLFGFAPYKHQLLLGWGTTSDDTEHACLTAQSLLSAGDDVDKFASRLGARLRWWFAALPPEAGWATAKACVRLWLGWSPKNSGVMSAGNGAAMRAPILGVYFADQPELLKSMVDASTRTTHRDERAIEGARIIARAAAIAAGSRARPIHSHMLLRELCADCKHPDLRRAMETAEMSFKAGESLEKLAERLGCHDGVSGYICHTAPVVLFAWLREPNDFRAAVESVIALGGDTDTHGALVGALVGITAGAHALPKEWLDGIVNWPHSVTWMRRLAQRLAADGSSKGALTSFWPAIPIRNLIVLTIILAHGFRRLLPPY